MNPTSERLQQILRKHHVPAILIADNANIFYTAERFFRGYVYMASDSEPLEFIIRPQDFTPSPGRIAIRKPEQIPAILAERGISLPHSIGLEMDSLPYSDIMRLSKIFPEAKPVNSSPLLRESRMVKTPCELALMREDGLHQTEVYHRITGLYREEMTDVEFQIEIERVLRLEGCLGFIRTAGNLMEINMGSVLAGDNADYPAPYDFAMGGRGLSPALPGGADGSVIRQGSTVMVDMNGSFNGYQTDMTRVWSLGNIPEIAYKAHDCSRRILRDLEQQALPGVEICSLYHRAIGIVEAEGLSKYFMGHRQKAAFIGHGVGIELNEQPPITARNTTPIVENMTLAIEPKFVIPGVGAVGVENTYITTSAGLKCITPFPEPIIPLRP